jgi:hypothetical protein
LKRLLVLLAVVATPVVGFVPAAHAVGAATCVIGGTMTLTAPSGTGVGAWEINPGLIDCNGAVNGYRIWGSGPFTGRGTYTTLSPAGGPCRHQIGIGMVDYTFQSGAMVFHKQESQRFVVAGGGEFTTPSLRGTLQLAPPYQGDCLTQPVTKATFAAQGVMVWTAPFFFGRSAGRPHGGL